MKSSSKVLGCVAISSAIAVTMILAAETTPPTAGTGWQHLAFETEPSLRTPETGRRINQLGRDGWELVDVAQIDKDGSTEKLIYFFKKPLE